MKVKLKDIEFDKEIYPRKQTSNETVEQYIEALKGGTEFPPVEVQKINYNGTEKLTCLDGKHRVLAMEEYNKWLSRQKKEGNEEVKDLEPIKEVKVNQWKDDVVDRDGNLEEMRIRSVILNLTHGDRIKAQDLADVVHKIIKDRPIEHINGVQTELAQRFGYDKSTIGRLETSEGTVSDVIRKRRHPRDLKIWKLVRLGWTNKSVGKLYKMTPENVGVIQNKLDNQISLVQQQFFQKKKSVEEICRFNEMDELTVWTMILDGKEDLERFEKLNITLKPYDVWNFNNCNPLMGTEYPGRIPGQLIMNALYYYTSQGDLVADFMAGGGTTADACLLMNRKCFCSDINPQRDFIIEHDLNSGLPAMDKMKIKSPKLIFTDPPYWSMKKEDYGKKSVSETSLENYYEFIESYAKGCYSLLGKGGMLAFLIQNQTGRDLPAGKESIAHTYICSNLFQKQGFELRRIINCPQGTQQDQPQEVTKAKEERRMLGIVRDLLVFRK